MRKKKTNTERPTSTDKIFEQYSGVFIKLNKIEQKKEIFARMTQGPWNFGVIASIEPETGLDTRDTKCTCEPFWILAFKQNTILHAVLVTPKIIDYF